MNKMPANFKSCLQPRPNILVSCKGVNGENNALAVAYCCNCSYDPPMVMVGIVPSRYSYRLIKDSGCFVVNLVSTHNKALFDYLGSHSGRDGDKLEAINARLGDGIRVNAPILVDCPVNIECRVVNSIVTGSHEMFVGKVEYVHADPHLIKKNGDLDFSMFEFL
ncbi:MAG: flavin reductase family protein [Limnochordia bacterium]|nr:flavin reductase family protein [Limnochordia bacterium]